MQNNSRETDSAVMSVFYTVQYRIQNPLPNADAATQLPRPTDLTKEVRPDRTDSRLQVQKTPARCGRKTLALSSPPITHSQAPKQDDTVAVIGVLFDASPGSTGAHL